jgi:hypothetical protein
MEELDLISGVAVSFDEHYCLAELQSADSHSGWSILLSKYLTNACPPFFTSSSAVVMAFVTGAEARGTKEAV